MLMPKQILRLGIPPREVLARSAAKKKVKPRIRPDRGQKIAILPCSITPFPALVAGTYPPYRLGHRCRWTEIARQAKLTATCGPAAAATVLTDIDQPSDFPISDEGTLMKPQLEFFRGVSKW